MKEIGAGEWGTETREAYLGCLRHILETNGDLYTFAVTTEQSAADAMRNDWPNTGAQMREVADMALAIYQRRAMAKEFAERLGSALTDYINRHFPKQEPAP